MPPVRIAEYTIERTLGSGSFGEVFLARDAAGGAVAIKLLLPEAARDAAARRRFEREARASLGVRHPNVVAAIATGAYEDRPFLVTEFASGGSLLDLLERERRLAPDRALRIAADVFRGLGAIHRAGLVHRDLKPANVLLAADGRAQIADLGLTRSVSVERTLLTREGLILGTPAFVAPEQVERGESVDGRADLYSAGVMLYQMLAGVLPFTCTEPLDLLRAHVGEIPPDPARFAPIPGAVSAFVSRLLAKDPGARPRDAAAAIAVIDELLAVGTESIARTLRDDASDRNAASATRPDAVEIGATVPLEGPHVSSAAGSAALALRDETGAVLFLHAAEELVFGRDAARGDPSRVCLRALAGADARERSLRISGRHCALRRSGTRWLVRDLRSANGTRLDGQPLAPEVEVELRDGSTIAIAEVCMLRARFVGSTEKGSAAVGAPNLLLERVGDGEHHRFLCVVSAVALDLRARPVGVGVGDGEIVASDGLLWTRSGSTLRSAESLRSGNLFPRPIEADDPKR